MSNLETEILALKYSLNVMKVRVTFLEKENISLREMKQCVCTPIEKAGWFDDEIKNQFIALSATQNKKFINVDKKFNNSNTIINDIQKENRLMKDELSKIVENRLLIENDVNSVKKKLKDLDQLSLKNRQSLIEIERTLESETHQSRQFSNKAEPPTPRKQNTANEGYHGKNHNRERADNRKTSSCHVASNAAEGRWL